MLILALDTATDQGSLALMAADRLLLEFSLKSQGTYLTRLLPEVEALLKAAGRSLKEVGAIAVSQGPGNFTGLRIGLATAKGLAWALGCSLVPVPTLEVLAAQVPLSPHQVGVLVDAKRREVYFGLFRGHPGQPQPLLEPQRLPVALLPARLKPRRARTGPGLNAYGDFLKETLPPQIQWAPPQIRHPRAATVARLALPRLARGLTASPAQLTPIYLRPAL